ncbi:MAG: deoxynucleoside kinase [Candidatus Euphemobacter frigidus]|nr:deoxynucleoside kinase [Candidatus Euphemobacter frigidus]
MNSDDKINQTVESIITEIKPLDEKEALKQIWDEAEGLQTILKKNPVIMMMAGNIGLGKTTTAKIISTFGKITIDIEDPHKELLKLYYENMGFYAERLQIDLICQRLNQIVVNSLLYPDSSISYDRSPYEDPLIFAQALLNHEQISRESLDFCCEYFMIKKRELEGKYPEVQFEPDLLIILKARVESGWARVHVRQRAIEVRKDRKKGRGLTKEFYRLLDGYCNALPSELRRKNWYQGPILTLAEDKLAVADVTNIKGQLYVVKSVKETLKIIYS